MSRRAALPLLLLLTPELRLGETSQARSVLAAAAPAGCIDAVSVGGFHGLTLASNTTQGFGEGGAGQLDVPPALAGLTLGVAAGGFFSCALHRVSLGTANTSVSCWGAASAGVVDVPPSVKTGSGPTALAAGGYHACVVLASGSAACWGANGAGQVSPLPATVASSGVASLALGSYHSCATKTSSGSVTCWGRDDRGQVSGLPPFLAAGAGSSTRIACGGYHCCAWGWGPGGSNLTCWGASSAGQTLPPSSLSLAAPIGGACAGGYFSCALQGGSVSCWGSNSKGETALPPGATDGNVASLACGWYGACALKSNGSLVCWGGSLAVDAAAALAGVDVAITTATASGGSSGTLMMVTGDARGSPSGAIVLSTGASVGGRRGAISLSASAVVVNATLSVTGNVMVGKLAASEFKLGSTVLTEASLGALLYGSPDAGSSAAGAGWAISTVAGNMAPAFSSSTGSTISFGTINGIAVDQQGTVYLSESNRIRKISLSGNLTTLAGSGVAGYVDGQDVSAAFNNPKGIAVDGAGNVYIADYANHRIRKISAAGAVTTLAGNGTAAYANGQGIAAAFNNPSGVAVDSLSNVYVAEYNNNRIRKISSGGAVTTLAGSGAYTFADGQGTAASFKNPSDVALDVSGNVYVADTSNHRIRAVTPSGAVTTLAGNTMQGNADGQGTAASFFNPSSITANITGTLYVTDNIFIREITPSGTVRTLLSASSTLFAIAVDSVGNLFYLSNWNLQRYSLNTGLTSTYKYVEDPSIVGGDGLAVFEDPSAVAVDPSGCLYVAESGNHVIRKISPTGAVTTLAGNGTAAYADGLGAGSAFNNPQGVAWFDASSTVYVADTNNQRIRKVSTSGTVTTLAGSGSAGWADGQGTLAVFNGPSSIAVDTSGTVFVADSSNHRIRKISPAGVVTTLAGSGIAGYADGVGSAAVFNSPYSVAVDSGGVVYVADSNNHRIRKITANGAVTTIAGTWGPGYGDGQGIAAAFNKPQGVAVDSSGNVYVADASNNRIRMISPGGVVTTLAGSGGGGLVDGRGSLASLSGPSAVAMDGTGNVYIADKNNRRIRKLTP